jgi:hypothetical protein
MRKIRAMAPAAMGLMAILGCGDGGGASDGEEATRAAEAEAPRAEALRADPSSDTAPSPSVEGRITFAFDGQPFQFHHLPADLNYHTSVASSAGAKPHPESSEVLRLIFLSVDLKALEYPTELPPRERRAPATAAAMVGFSYIDASGQEWAGPGTVLMESFDGAGRLVLTFDGVRLPHTDKARPDITLTRGEVRAVLD